MTLYGRFTHHALCLEQVGYRQMKTRRDISRTVEDSGYITIECMLIVSHNLYAASIGATDDLK